MWQDFVFLAGSVLSIVFLAPTVRDANARVPLGSSIPSMTIGSIYSFTYATMGMTFSALGSIGVATMWSLIAFYRAPGEQTGPKNVLRFLESLAGQGYALVTSTGDRTETTTADHDPAAD
ncbi:hypothetical protein C490_04337 [Natronobacterium gregoryi SP2]|nr:hypothetical protein C490_04337 [Natronobacterium gregoryi SP2]